MPCYILDGYNIIKRSKIFSSKDLYTQREVLIQFLISKKPQGSYQNKVIVVFDGNSNVFEHKTKNLRQYNIEVIFTFGQSADEKIKQIVSNLKNPKNFFVVTNDKEIRYYVRYYGVSVLSVKDFIKIDKLKPLTHKSDKNNLSLEEVRKINDELKNKFGI